MKFREYRRRKWKRYKQLKSQNLKFKKCVDWLKIKKYENKKRAKYLKSHTNNNIDKMLIIPSNLDFKTNINDVKLLTDRVKQYLQLSYHHTRIDLSQLNTISINGLMYLISKIDTIQNRKAQTRFNLISKFKYNPKYGLNKNNDKLKYLLYKIGYWDYFGIPKPYEINSTLDEEYFLSIKSDTISKSEYVAELREFISKKVHFLKNDIIQDYFDDAITETMSNSVEHGYIDQTSYRVKGKWWLCGHYDKNNEYLEFSFRDYGVGLRRTLEYNSDNGVKSFFRSIMNTNKSDSEIIKLLVNDKLPKYKGKKDKVRGYGFKKFKEFAQNISYDCEMKIVSGNGRYDYKHYAVSGNDEEILTDMNFKIDGFLISWKIYLGGM